MKRLSWLVMSSLSLAVVGCARPQVSVEVLPPRTSVTCAAPDAGAAAFGRGLFDVGATADFHGNYVADLRLSVPGANARIDGFDIAYQIPDGSSLDAADYDGVTLTGDVLLAGEKDKVRVGVMESVELVPRVLAARLAADSGVGINKIDYTTLGVTLTPVVDTDLAEGLPTTFGLDLCEGCLVEPPDACTDVGTVQQNPVICRVGQDVPLFFCAAGGA